MKMNKINIFVFLLILLKSLFSKKTKTYPEIKNDLLEKIHGKYNNLSEANLEKRMLEMILTPKFHDLDQNGKITLDEIKKAFKYTLYYNYHMEDQKIVIFLKRLIEKFIDEYVDPDFLNYKQFSHFCYRFKYKELVNIMTDYKEKIKYDL